MEANRVLSAFVSAWINSEWNNVLFLCQKTWAQGKTANDVEDKLSRKPSACEIISHTNLGNVKQEIKVKLAFSDGEVTVNRAILVCESAPFCPAVYGDWGVNPVSILQVVEVLQKASEKPQNKPKNESKKKSAV